MRVSGNLDRNDRSSAPMPFIKYAVVTGNHLLKHLRGKRHFIVPVTGNNEDVVAAYFDAWEFLAEVAWSHVHIPLRSSAEQQGIRRVNLDPCNPVTTVNALILRAAS